MARVLTVSAARDLLTDAFGRIYDGVAAVLDGVDRGDLTRRVAADANTMGWLVWHLLRVQDSHVADVAGTEEVWTSSGFFERSKLPFDPAATGYGQSSAAVAATDLDPAVLIDYAGAVHDATTAFVDGLDDADLDRVVDDSWDPPVTLGARLISVVEDDLKHLGQAELVAGLLDDA